MTVLARPIPSSMPDFRGLTEEIMRRQVYEGTLAFTRYMFKATHGKTFVTGKHHRLIAKALDRVFRGKCRRLIINIAPRYGKTELAVKMAMALGLAYNAAAKFIHLSYSDDLALDNSDDVRTYIKHPAYQALFPHVQVKKDSDSKKKWYTTEGGGVYATSAAGQVTGFGAGNMDEALGDELTDEERAEEKMLEDFLNSLSDQGVLRAPKKPSESNPAPAFQGAIIIDDPIKPEDADSEQIREKVNKRFDSTIRSRTNSRETPIIIVMQRLHPSDLVGYLLEQEPGEWEVLSLPALQPDGTALFPHKHTVEELFALRTLDVVTFERQYQQNPAPREGLLYKVFKTYVKLPPGCGPVRCHVDVADQGKDFLCAIFYRMHEGLAYVTHVIYTQERAEETEKSVAEELSKRMAELMRSESNNGGRFFGRNVERFCRMYKNYRTRVEYYAERKNKEGRILNAAANVNNFFVFPADWPKLFPKFHKAVTGYMAVGKNEHDDAPDCMTGAYEHEVIRSNKGVKRRR
jgi:predicted phage terminase large subunit-like protein